MDTKTFNENYTVDTKSKRGVRANPKNGAKPLPEAKTADGEVFKPEQRYFFFDCSTGKVRETIGIRRVDAEFLGSFGLRVCKISELRTNRADALADGQLFLRNQITELDRQIQQFEVEKTAQNDTPKII